MKPDKLEELELRASRARRIKSEIERLQNLLKWVKERDTSSQPVYVGFVSECIRQAGLVHGSISLTDAAKKLWMGWLEAEIKKFETEFEQC